MAHRLHLLIDAVQYHPSVIKQGSVPGHPSRRVEPSTYTATSPRARRPQGAPRRRSWAPLGGTTAGSSNDSSGLSSLRSRVLPTESDVPTHGDRTLVALVPPQRWVSRPVGHGSEARPNVPRRQAGSIVSHPKLAPLLPAALHPGFGPSHFSSSLGIIVAENMDNKSDIFRSWTSGCRSKACTLVNAVAVHIPNSYTK